MDRDYDSHVWLKKLLADACVEIARWKVKAEDLEKDVDKLQKELKDLRLASGVVRLPFGGVVK